MHHIISDGWSISLLYNELNAEYSRLLNGEANQLVAPNFVYTEYIDFENQYSEVLY